MEIKRPGEPVGKTELDQIRDYVLYLKERLGETTARKFATDLEGYLIVDSFSKGLHEHIKLMEHAKIFTLTWNDLLKDARRSYKEYYRIIKGRAPSNDPRMEALREWDMSKKPRD